jgi:hypothetical protein
VPLAARTISFVGELATRDGAITEFGRLASCGKGANHDIERRQNPGLRGWLPVPCLTRNSSVKFLIDLPFNRAGNLPPPAVCLHSPELGASAGSSDVAANSGLWAALNDRFRGEAEVANRRQGAGCRRRGKPNSRPVPFVCKLGAVCRWLGSRRAACDPGDAVVSVPRARWAGQPAACPGCS